MKLANALARPPGTGQLSLSAIATPDFVGGQLDLEARISEGFAVGAFGEIRHDWRARSTDYVAGLKAALRW